MPKGPPRLTEALVHEREVEMRICHRGVVQDCLSVGVYRLDFAPEVFQNDTEIEIQNGAWLLRSAIEGLCLPQESFLVQKAAEINPGLQM